MKKHFATLMAMLFLSAAAYANPTAAVLEKTHKAVHQIAQTTISSGAALCSSTAIGPHALLTATHCELPSNELFIGGVADPVHIIGRIRDAFDHTIYLLDYSFTDYVDISLDSANVKQGADVFIWGNPAQWVDVLRRGYVAGYDAAEHGQPNRALFDFQAFNGDSGSAIFNDDGVIIAVCMAIEAADEKDSHTLYRIQFTNAFPFGFTKESIAIARAYAPPAPSLKTTEGK